MSTINGVFSFLSFGAGGISKLKVETSYLNGMVDFGRQWSWIMRLLPTLVEVVLG